MQSLATLLPPDSKAPSLRGYSLEIVSEEMSLDQRFGGDDQSVLREAYDAHGALVFTLCRRALSAEDAADVTQEVFLSAWRARDRFDTSRGSLPAWLVGIAKNRIIDNHRARGRRPQTVDVEIDAGEPAEVEKLGDRMLVRQVLTQLPDRQRRHIEMFFFEDLTHPQIAEKSGFPLGTVKSDIRRSLKKLRHELEQAR